MNRFTDITKCIYIKTFYYMIKNKKNIEIYNDNLTLLNTINLNDEYSTFTYNDDENCFYLCKPNNKKYIYSSTNFKTFLPISLPIECQSEIKDINYSKRMKSILITTSTKILMFNIEKKQIKTIFEIKEEIEKSPNYYKDLNCVNNNTTLESAICCNNHIYLIYRKRGISFISRLIKGKLEKPFYKTCYFIKSIFQIKQKLWILVDIDQFQKLISLNINCSCNPRPKDCECEMIESIVQLEKSLSRILNNEGLKIQAAIEKTEDIDELVCINSSVKDMVYHVTILEFILTEKLKLITNCNKCDC